MAKPAPTQTRRRVAGLLLAVLAVVAGTLTTSGPVAATSPPIPYIAKVTPAHGPAAGGNEVVLEGFNLNLLEGGFFRPVFGGTRGRVVSTTATSAVVVAPAGTAGLTVDVTVVGDFNTYPSGPDFSATNDYTYDGRTRRPLKLTPEHGSPLGGTTVTLTGAGIAFRTPRSVTFGGVAATIVSSTDSSVTVTTPAGTPGSKAEVVVTTAAGDLEGTQWSRFEYDYTTQPPRITGVEGSPGLPFERFIVNGSSLKGATNVTVGGEPTYFSWNETDTGEQLTVSVPPLLPGTYDVVVTTPVGVSANSAADDVEILGDAKLPILDSISPNHGPAAGGTQVTVRGRNLGTAQQVRVDFRTATNLEVVSDSEIRFTTPEIVSYHDAVDVEVTTATGTTYLDSRSTRNDFTIDLVPGHLSLSPNHGPAGAPTVAVIAGTDGLDIRRVAHLLLVRPGEDPVELIPSFFYPEGVYKVTIPAGVAGQTARLEARSYEGTLLNGEGDSFTWDAPAGSFAYDTKGTATLKNLARGSFGVTGGAQLTLAPAGTVTGTLQFNQANARLTALGLLPVTAKLAFVPASPTSGTFAAGVLKTTTKVRIKVLEAKLFGAIPLVGGNNCQTKQLTDLPLASAAGFDLATGGRLNGTFKISDLNGCGALNGLVSPVTAGGGNTLSLDLAPRP